MKPTWCEDCDLVEPVSRKSNPRNWLCTKHPRTEGMGFVVREKWTDSEPYLRCNQVNAGACPLYKPRRTAQMELDT
jgi:hypothetical protein